MDKITGLQLRQTNNDTYAVPIGVWAQNVLWDESSILPDIIGDLDNLTTVNKGTLVAAINEAATTGSGSGSGSGSGTTITVDTALSSTSTNPVQNKVINTALNSKAGTAVATTSANGLMSSTDKTTLNSHETRITALENNSGSGSGSSTVSSNSEWSTKKALFFGDSIGYGEDNNGYSFIDILQEKNFFSSVYKNCTSGNTSITLYTHLQESETEIASADIIYCEYEYNDIVGLMTGNLSTTALVNSLNTAISYIRARNATCQIVWMPLTISHFEKIGNPAGASQNLTDYYKQWARAMYPAFASYGISLLPIYDNIVDGHRATSTSIHPSTIGHEAIAEHLIQMPLGTSNFTVTLLDDAGSSSGSESVVTVIYDGTATIQSSNGFKYILLNNISDTIAVGDLYRVTWGDTATMLTAKSTTIDGTTYAVIGNPSIVGGTDDGSGLTYVGYKYNATQLRFLTSESAGAKQLKVEKYSMAEATTASAGLMTAEDKQHLNAVYADYSAALAALGV